MDDVEKRISSSVQIISSAFEHAIITFIRLILLPLALPLRLAKLAIPPALHIAILVSLLPFLGLFSLSAGVLVSRWLPRGWGEQAFLQYGQSTAPFGFATVRNLKASQPYDISVHLVVPLSQANYDLGNFMTSVTFTTMNNRTVAVSQRPALLVPPLAPFRLLSTSSLTTIVVPLFDSFVPGYSNLRAKIEVGRTDGWKELGSGEGRELAVVEAYIKGNVKLRGLIALLAISPTATSIITSVIFFFTSAIIALALYFTFSPSFTSTPVDEASGQGATVTRPAERELKPALRRRRSSTMVEIKAETEGSGDRALRRRRSVLSERSPSVESSSRRP